MTSSMLAGERKWASSRRGGMTVLGKVAVPKPINLPSQKLENHGLDPNVEIVPKGSSSWGSRPSSSTSNPWGSSAVSPKADGTTVLPHHPSGRPTSSSGLSRPSTAGSDRHDPSATAWGSNSRPSSASGVLTSNQSSLTSSRPLSAETRPGSSHLSRFAEPVYDNNSVAWGPNGTADQSVPSRADGFSLSSGDFPTLGSEKDNTSKSGEPQDHDSHVRPGSGSGRHAPMKDRNEMAQADHRSGNVDTWTRDGSPRFNDGVGVRPNADNWHQGDSHQYVNPNLPQHYDAWPRPPMNAHPGVWYRGPPPAGSPYPHVPHGGFPMEPFPYYHPQPGPPPGPGPRGHHPRNGDFYRPQMPDAFIRPGAPYRPGFYHGPVPYDGYYAPPMGYNPNDHEMPFMGMPRGPHGPPVYNMCPPQNPSELNDPHFRGGVRGPVGNMFVSEQMDSIPPEESRGPYKVLRKHENEKNADMEEDSWEPNMEKNDHPKLSFQKNERGTDTRRNDPVILHSSQGPHRSRASSGSWGNKSSISEDSKDSTLIQKIEDLNAKARASDIRGDAEQTNKLLNNPKGNSTIAFGTIPTTGDHTNPYDRPAHHEVRNRADHLSKGRLSNQDSDGWRKTPPILGSEVAPENRISAETKVIGEPLTQMADPADGQAQRARMKELARQRAIELQKEEEERIREQKAKALAKLEELNRRTLGAADDTTAEKNSTSVSEQEDVIQVDRSQKPTEPASDKKAEVVTQISEDSQQVRVDRPLLSKQSDAESKASLGSDGGVNKQKRASHRQKQSLQVVGSSVDKSTPSGAGVELLKNSGSNVTVASHRQKQSLQVVDSSVDKSTFSGTGGEIIKNPGSNVNVSGEAVQSQESTLPNNSNTLSESTQHKKKNNKSSKNKHKLEASASREADLVKPDSQFDAKQSSLDQISSLPSNQYNKPQHARRMPRNPQANRVHGGDVAVWAPVRSQNKEVVVQDDVALPEKTINNSGQTNPKSKRAEMERYVPKPVAKELAHQGGVIQSTVEDKTDAQAIPVSSNVRPSMESKSGDNKQVKPHGAWGQRNQGFQQDSKKVFHKPTSQHEESNTVPTETGTVHEWDPSDGWFMPDEYPPTEITPVVKDEGGFAGKGKKQAYKGQRSTVKNQMQSGAEVEVDQTDRPASSKENRSSHWQPKPQAYKSGWSGGQNANPEVKREPVHDDHQDGRRERKPVSFRGRTHPPNQNQGFGNIEDEAQFEQQHHHVSSGFRKYGGQNNRSSGQDDNKSKHSYQPVGSNNNSNKSSHLDPPADGAPRYKDRGLGQSRRGGGEFYRRQ